MEKRTTYFVSRKNVLTWLVAILLLGSAALRIAFFCGVKGAEAVTMWMGLILPLAASLFYGITVLFNGKEHLFRTAFSFGLMCAYLAWISSVALQSTWFSILMWILMLAIAVIYNVVLVGKIRHNWLLVLVLLAVIGTQAYLGIKSTGMNPVKWNAIRQADILMLLAVFFTVLAMSPHLDGQYHPTWGDRKEGRRVRTVPAMSYVTP